MYSKLLWSAALLAVLSGCQSDSSPAGPVGDVPSKVLQVDILGLEADAPIGLGAGVTCFDARINDKQGTRRSRPAQQRALTVPVFAADEGPANVTILALNDAGETLSHFQTIAPVPGQLVTHARSFVAGAPQPAPSGNGWELRSTTPVPGNPGLSETVWQAAVNVHAPFQRSQYDVIGLHRVVGLNPRPGRVLLYLPGASVNGGLYTSDETRDFRLYLANRGYDVYSLDYRTHFVPPLNVPGLDVPFVSTGDLSFMAAWDSSIFVEDVALAIAQARQVSATPQVFLAGFSSGGQIAYFYAASQDQGQLGAANLRGLIAMDGGPWQVNPMAPPSSLSVAVARAAVLGGDTPQNRAVLEAYGTTPGPGFYNNGFDNIDPEFALALVLYLIEPLAPSPVEGYALASDYLVFRFQTMWGVNAAGDGQLTNVQRGFNTLDMLLVFSVVGTDPFWPIIQDLEDAVLTNFIGPVDGPWTLPVPDGDLYLQNLPQVTTPQLVFGSGALDSYVGTRISWKYAGIAMSSSTDTETHLLQGFGHLDILSGTQAAEKVAEPMLKWLDKH